VVTLNVMLGILGGSWVQPSLLLTHTEHDGIATMRQNESSKADPLLGLVARENDDKREKQGHHDGLVVPRPQWLPIPDSVSYRVARTEAEHGDREKDRTHANNF
jgi:hypothetical protein